MSLKPKAQGVSLHPAGMWGLIGTYLLLSNKCPSAVWTVKPITACLDGDVFFVFRLLNTLYGQHTAWRLLCLFQKETQCRLSSGFLFVEFAGRAAVSLLSTPPLVCRQTDVRTGQMWGTHDEVIQSPPRCRFGPILVNAAHVWYFLRSIKRHVVF